MTEHRRDRQPVTRSRLESEFVGLAGQSWSWLLVADRRVECPACDHTLRLLHGRCEGRGVPVLGLGLEAQAAIELPDREHDSLRGVDDPESRRVGRRRGVAARGAQRVGVDTFSIRTWKAVFAVIYSPAAAAVAIPQAIMNRSEARSIEILCRYVWRGS